MATVNLFRDNVGKTRAVIVGADGESDRSLVEFAEVVKAWLETGRILVLPHPHQVQWIGG